MKSIGKFLMLCWLAISALIPVSCSSEDDEGGASGVPYADFLEVEVDGVRKRVAAETFVYVDLDYSLYLQTCPDELTTDVGRFTFEMVSPKRMSSLARCEAGAYGLNNYQTLNLILNLEVSSYRVHQMSQGTHVVTLIKRVGDVVVVEGEFLGKMDGVNKLVRGKYRITLDDLEVDTDQQFESRGKGLGTNECSLQITANGHAYEVLSSSAWDGGVRVLLLDKYQQTPFDFTFSHPGKENIIELIRQEGEGAKNKLQHSISCSHLMNIPYQGDHYTFAGYKFEILSLRNNGGTVTIEGKVSANMEYSGFYTDPETGWMESYTSTSTIELFEYMLTF